MSTYKLSSRLDFENQPDMGERTDRIADIEGKIRGKQLEVLCEQLPLVLLVSTGLAAMLVAMLWTSTGQATLLLWFGFLASVSLARFIVSRRLRSAPDRERVIAATAGAFLGGISWGMVVIFLHQDMAVAYQIAIILVLGGVAAGAAVSHAADFRVSMAFLSPCLLPLALWLLFYPTSAYSGLAAFVFVYGAALATVAFSYRKQFVTSTRLALANELLLDDLARGNQELRDEINTRRDLEDQARQSEQRFRDLIESAPDAMLVADDRGTIVYANERVTDLFGYQVDELMGREIEILIPSRFARHAQLRNDYLARPKIGSTSLVGSLTGRRKDGVEVPVDITLSTLNMRGGKAVLAAVRDCSEKHRVHEELKQAKQEAERANRSKSEFLANMSHELRTPLNAILGYAQLMAYEEQLSPSQSENVVEIRRAGEHLLELIGDILDLSRIEASQLQVSLEAVPMAGIVEECVALVRTQAEERHIQLDTDSAVCANTTVWADKRRLKQVLLNLMSNAIKYNHENGRIKIACASAADRRDRVRIDVIDTGNGIAEAYQEQLFEPFNRLNAHESGVQGTGIGLVISRSLVEAMGGRLEFESRAGVGSRFSVELGLHKADRESSAA